MSINTSSSLKKEYKDKERDRDRERDRENVSSRHYKDYDYPYSSSRSYKYGDKYGDRNYRDRDRERKDHRDSRYKDYKGHKEYRDYKEHKNHKDYRDHKDHKYHEKDYKYEHKERRTDYRDYSRDFREYNKYPNKANDTEIKEKRHSKFSYHNPFQPNFSQNEKVRDLSQCPSNINNNLEENKISDSFSQKNLNINKESSNEIVIPTAYNANVSTTTYTPLISTTADNLINNQVKDISKIENTDSNLNNLNLPLAKTGEILTPSQKDDKVQKMDVDDISPSKLLPIQEKTKIFSELDIKLPMNFLTFLLANKSPELKKLITKHTNFNPLDTSFNEIKNNFYNSFIDNGKTNYTENPNSSNSTDPLCNPLLLIDETKINFPKEKIDIDNKSKILRKEIFNIKMKIDADNKSNISTLNDKIYKIDKSTKLLMIKQSEIRKSLNEIFSDY